MSYKVFNATINDTEIEIYKHDDLYEIYLGNRNVKWDLSIEQAFEELGDLIKELQRNG